ncbi:hypothetical protein P3X46_007621 [Hevea brasiliensis]|uniref:DUF4408 domain-containing protein n=1 Tax=Hevea brasiliensis TaxID=3981 RepID=A0ABQ9MU44_HEVBR|nr:pathogen-associated molecular patterns-induced protein A70 [Hevea brasiliensis]KAJ9183814.1 hypothetical protein P3X46_007621 [Hevea brasiliensis]
MADAAASPASMWGFITGWFTPAYLFLLLNLVIGTIALTSRFGSNRRKQEQEQIRPLARSPSLLERVKSINLSFYSYPRPHSEATNDSVHDTEPEYTPGAGVHPVQIERTPSFLERVMSIKLSSFSNFPPPHSEGTNDSVHDTEPEYTPGAGVHPVQLEQTPSFLERVKSIKLSSFYNYAPPHSEATNDSVHDTEPEYTPGVHPVQLERASSLLERLKSIKLSSFYRSEPESEFVAEPESDSYEDTGHASVTELEHQVKRSKSEPRVAAERKTPEKMKKSASEREVAVEEDRESVERRRPATMRIEKTVSFGDEGVDAKADDFINRFKQQLKLQRLDSLLRYRDVFKGK